MAIKQIQPTKGGRFGLLAHVAHLDAEVKATLVDIELTTLEDSQFCDVTGIEITEGDIVLQQLVEVAIEVQEFGKKLEVSIFLGHLFVEILDFCGLVVSKSRNVSVKFRCHRVPLSLVDAVCIGVIDADSEFFDGVECCLPSGVDDIGERQFLFLAGASQRVVCNLVGACGEVFLADGLDFLDRNVDSLRTGLVEGDELAAHKIVGHLIAYGVDSDDGFVGIVAVWTLVDDNGRCIFLGFDLLVEGGLGCDDVGKRYFLLVESEGLENACCAVDYGFAIVSRGVDVCEGNLVCPKKQLIGIVKD